MANQIPVPMPGRSKSPSSYSGTEDGSHSGKLRQIIPSFSEDISQTAEDPTGVGINDDSKKAAAANAPGLSEQQEKAVFGPRADVDWEASVPRGSAADVLNRRVGVVAPGQAAEISTASGSSSVSVSKTDSSASGQSLSTPERGPLLGSSSSSSGLEGSIDPELLRQACLRLSLQQSHGLGGLVAPAASEIAASAAHLHLQQAREECEYRSRLTEMLRSQPQLLSVLGERLHAEKREPEVVPQAYHARQAPPPGLRAASAPAAPPAVGGDEENSLQKNWREYQMEFLALAASARAAENNGGPLVDIHRRSGEIGNRFPSLHYPAVPARGTLDYPFGSLSGTLGADRQVIPEIPYSAAYPRRVLDHTDSERSSKAVVVPEETTPSTMANTTLQDLTADPHESSYRGSTLITAEDAARIEDLRTRGLGGVDPTTISGVAHALLKYARHSSGYAIPPVPPRVASGGSRGPAAVRWSEVAAGRGSVTYY
jgi:hypothetical protein